MAEASPSQANLLNANQVRQRCAPEALGFSDSSELEPITGLIGQDRALDAIKFGAKIRQPAFNLFVLGPAGAGKSTAVLDFLTQQIASEEAACDWVYVNNFDTDHKPRAIALPRGRAQELKHTMIAIIDELRAALPAMFESEDYHAQRRAIDEEFRGKNEEALEELGKKAEAQNISILRTPQGFAMAPVMDGKVVKPEFFNALEEEKRKEIEAKVEALQDELEEILKHVPKSEKERRHKVRALNEELAESVVAQALSEAIDKFANLEKVTTFLKEAERDLIHNVGLFLMDEGEGEKDAIINRTIDTERDARFRRYMVNILVSPKLDNGERKDPARLSDQNGAPIIEENNPTLGNLVGRIEHISQMGTLMTDFLLIKPGALHRANGGYLLLDARKVLLNPLAWEGLKRAIKAEHVAIESPAEGASLLSTVSLNPEPIPLNVKVILFGDYQLYYQLSALDPDFPLLFKVQADFEDTISRSEENNRSYARLIASIVAQDKLRHVTASAAALLIEQGARMANDSAKLTIEISKIADILREADFWANDSGRALIEREDIARAINEQIRRADRVRARSHEQILRDVMMIDTQGAKVGQINGLSVLSLANFSFGKPTRITASVRMGAGRVVDIEREVALGGPLHSKGVMILWGILASRYVEDMPLSIAASLVFEQSYGGVDGDSASSTELYALLSALSDVPIKQSIAVTGSVNQRGEVQAIGGANEKIEGFFDICKDRGLSGDQGVMIPKANIVHLMLREDVVAAVEAGQFHIWAVETIDEGIEILTGVTAGARDESGHFPENSINYRVEARLRRFALDRRAYAQEQLDNNIAMDNPPLL